MGQSFTSGFEIILFCTCYQKKKKKNISSHYFCPNSLEESPQLLFSPPCRLGSWGTLGKYLEKRENIRKTDPLTQSGTEDQTSENMPSSSCIICEKLGSSTVVQTCILNGKKRREREGDEEGGGEGEGLHFKPVRAGSTALKGAKGAAGSFCVYR